MGLLLLFGDSLAGGFRRLCGEEGLQLVTLSPWRVRRAYSSRSTHYQIKLTMIIADSKKLSTAKSTKILCYNFGSIYKQALN